MRGDDRVRRQRAQLLGMLGTLQVPVLDADELVAPLVAVGKTPSPLLAVNKWIGDSRLGASVDGMLDPDNNDTLDPDNNDTLDPDSNDTLDPDSNDTISAAGSNTFALDGKTSPNSAGGKTSSRRVRRYGTSKSQYAAVVQRQSQTAGMFFRIVFLESCQSQLSGILLKQLRAGKMLHIGQIWSSDARGLKYSTCDYGRVFAALDQTTSFSEALSLTLRQHFDEEQRVRDEILK